MWHTKDIDIENNCIRICDQNQPVYTLIKPVWFMNIIKSMNRDLYYPQKVSRLIEWKIPEFNLIYY